MMNRIILIGNGFDLAHGLPTSYADFIRGYNITLKLGLLEGEYERYDGLCSVNISDPEDRKTLEQFRWMLQDNTFRFIRNLGEITPALLAITEDFITWEVLQPINVFNVSSKSGEYSDSAYLIVTKKSSTEVFKFSFIFFANAKCFRVISFLFSWRFCINS